MIETSASPNEWGSHLFDCEVILLAPIGPLTTEWIKKISAGASGKPILFLLSQALFEMPDLGTAIWGALPFSATGQDIILAIHALDHGLLDCLPGGPP